MAQSQQTLSFENWSHPTIKLAKKDGDMIVPIAKDEKAELLGQGAMGDVFLALDFSNNPKGAPIAIKVDNFKHSNAERRSYGIREEATPNEIDTSKNILRKSYDITGNIPILVSEYRPVFLNNLLKVKSETLTLEQRLSIILGIANGVAEFHSREYVCPDVKPDNVAIKDINTLEVQLADYGGYKVSDGKTTFTDSPRDNLGSVTYMPPENRSEIIGKNDEVVTGSFQSDVWIFGVNMYQLLTGKRGFFEDDEMRIEKEVKMKNSNLTEDELKVLKKSKLIEHREFLRQLSSSKKEYLNLEDQLIHEKIDSEVKDKGLNIILHKCLQYDRTKRYENMREVSSELKKYSSNLKLARQESKVNDSFYLHSYPVMIGVGGLITTIYYSLPSDTKIDPISALVGVTLGLGLGVSIPYVSKNISNILKELLPYIQNKFI